MHRQVIEMLESGVIEPSTCAWSSPVVMIRNSNDKYRFCIDFRKLNAVSKADAYPLPYMDAILRKVKSAKYISTLDLSSAYHQIPLTPESKELTAFTVFELNLIELKFIYLVVKSYISWWRSRIRPGLCPVKQEKPNRQTTWDKSYQENLFHDVPHLLHVYYFTNILKLKFIT